MLLSEMNLKKVHRQVIASIILVPGLAFAEQAIGPIDCLSYWQLRSVGLEREHRIDSATKKKEYQQNYKSGLHRLKQTVDPSSAAKQVFGSMESLLEEIDYDYDRTGELDAKYLAFCDSSQ